MTDFSVAFRTDAALHIGSGHVMRCLALADALRANGARCLFICRDHPGHLGDTIVSRGHALHVLAVAKIASIADGNLAHSEWLGASWQADAAETRAILSGFNPDWLIVDHYGIDARWEKAALHPDTRLMVIDDLADRKHIADVLLDQNLGRTAEDYNNLVPATCHRLIGPNCALLRPEFAAQRKQSLLRRADGQLNRILVSMGGVDPQNITGRILDVIAGVNLPESIKVTVVLGRDAPNLELVRIQASKLQFIDEVCCNPTNMAELMADADLAVGAAGGTAWERCCMGLPTLLLVLAENQRQGAAALNSAGAIVLVGDIGKPDWQKKLGESLAACLNPQTLSILSRNAEPLCDGLGTERVVRHLLFADSVDESSILETAEPSDLRVRPANKTDSWSVWAWRNGGGAAKFYLSAEETPFADHDIWFSNALLDHNRIMLIIEDAGIPVAHVRFDIAESGTADISICLDPASRGKGLGSRAVVIALQSLHGTTIQLVNALVHPENAPSIALFKRCGFQYVGEELRFLKFQFSLVNAEPEKV